MYEDQNLQTIHEIPPQTIDVLLKDTAVFSQRHHCFLSGTLLHKDMRDDIPWCGAVMWQILPQQRQQMPRDSVRDREPRQLPTPQWKIGVVGELGYAAGAS